MPKTAIHPISRLEGHEKIELFLDGDGRVQEAYWQAGQGEVERFFLGRPAEEMPRIAPNICGEALFAHHLASAKAVDALYGVEPPPAARLIRELALNASHIEDCIRVFFSPPGSTADFMLSSGTGIAGRIDRMGRELALQAIAVRKRNRKIMNNFFGRASHPEGGLPGGVSRGALEKDRAWIREAAALSLEFVQSLLERFKTALMADRPLMDQILNSPYRLKAYTMAQVDARNRMSLYDGRIRIMAPDGQEYARFAAEDYGAYIGEWTAPRTAVRFTHLKPLGWQGLAESENTSLYVVDPLTRLRVSKSLQTSQAQNEARLLFDVLEGNPAHHPIVLCWARLIAALQASERNVLIADKPQLTSRDLRNMNFKPKAKGVGAAEAPQGILIHHYEADEDGVLTRAVVLAPARNNAAPISLCLKKAAQEFVNGQDIREEFLDRAEAALRMFAPALSCAGQFPGRMPIDVTIRNLQGEVVREIRRD